jgi:voltage-gated potassium channel
MQFTLYFLQVFFFNLLYASPLLLFLTALICLIGFLIGRIGGWPGFDVSYHAFINATTVGYGDFRPTRKSANAPSIVLVGLIFTGLLVAIALHAANHAYEKMYEESSFSGR